jgi:hypothetical protein
VRQGKTGIARSGREKSGRVQGRGLSPNQDKVEHSALGQAGFRPNQAGTTKLS